jgi:hypothetical protein
VRVQTMRQLPPGVWHGTENERVAVSLTQGRGWSDAFAAGSGPTAHLAPLYPLLLSGVYRLFGTYETASGQMAQQGLSLTIATLVVLLLPATARKLGLSEAAGWAAAFLAAWLPANLWTEVGGHHEQGIAALTLVGLIWALASLSQASWRGRRPVLWTGVLLGLTALGCPTLLLVPMLFVLLAWACRPGERQRILQCGLILAAVSFVMVAPWTLRNRFVLGGFVPIRSNFGLELAVGNRPGANGHTYASGMGDMHPYCSAAERVRLLHMGELAYVRDKQRQAFTWIADHPAQFGWLTLRRMWLFCFTPNETWCSLEPRLLLGSRIYGFLGIATLLELLRLLRRGHPAGGLLLCAFVGAGFPYFVTHVEMRYRLPIVGLTALASCSLVLAIAGWVRGRFRRVAPSSAEQVVPASRAA